jgi:hypothetical protein
VNIGFALALFGLSLTPFLRRRRLHPISIGSVIAIGLVAATALMLNEQTYVRGLRLELANRRSFSKVALPSVETPPMGERPPFPRLSASPTLYNLNAVPFVIQMSADRTVQTFFAEYATPSPVPKKFWSASLRSTTELAFAPSLDFRDLEGAITAEERHDDLPFSLVVDVGHHAAHTRAADEGLEALLPSYRELVALPFHLWTRSLEAHPSFSVFAHLTQEGLGLFSEDASKRVSLQWPLLVPTTEAEITHMREFGKHPGRVIRLLIEPSAKVTVSDLALVLWRLSTFYQDSKREPFPIYVGSVPSARAN